MPKLFEKGNKGKPKGAKSKKTIEAVRRVEYVIGLLEENLDRDIRMLESKERVNLWNTLQEYVRPKLQRTELIGKDGESLNLSPTINVLPPNGSNT